MIDSNTALFAIIGNPVSHSLSPIMHNAAFKEIGFNAVYLAFKVSNLKEAIIGIRELGLRGLSITIPYKEEVIKHIDEIDQYAQRMEAVNTIVNDNGVLKGYNTDGMGAYNAIKKSVDIDNERVSIIGNGGTAKSIVFTLLSYTKLKHLTIFGRNETKIQAFIKNIQKHFSSFVNIDFYTNFSSNNSSKAILSSKLLINTSPIGMEGYDLLSSPIPKELIKREHTVFDVVYKPLKTKLIEYAEEKNASVINGLAMLINQGVIQFELWTGQKAPKKLMLDAISKVIYK